MKYNLYLKGAAPQPIFIQAAATAEGLQKSRDTLCRWVAEMGVEVRDPEGKTLVIQENGVSILELPYASLKRTWRAIKP